MTCHEQFIGAVFCLRRSQSLDRAVAGMREFRTWHLANPIGNTQARTLTLDAGGEIPSR